MNQLEASHGSGRSRLPERVRLLKDRLFSTLWFLPSLIVLFSAALAAVLVMLSPRVDRELLATMPRLFGASADSSRDMLAAIAGSIITVAGVTFSITMLVVTQASAQYTPRILRNFMRDKASQVVLGGLAGVFTYCLIVLRTIREGDEGHFVPSIAVMVGFLLAIVSIALLIYFVHHVTSALQASSIISQVAADTHRAVERLFPAELGEPAGADTFLPEPTAEADALDWVQVPSPRTGYVQSVDSDRLLSAAVDHDTVVRMTHRVGDFVVEGSSLAEVAVPLSHDRAGAPGWQVPDAIRSALEGAFELAPHRTVEQDPGFGVQQLVDIALRALSPSVNDPSTAIICIDYLGAVLVHAAARGEEPLVRRENGVLRVIARGTTFQQLLDDGLHQIRRYADGHVAVLGRLVNAVRLTAAASRTAPRRHQAARHLDHLEEVIRRSVPSTVDMELLTRSLTEARVLLADLPPRQDGGE